MIPVCSLFIQEERTCRDISFKSLRKSDICLSEEDRNLFWYSLLFKYE